MKYRAWMGILGFAVLSAGWLASANLHAATTTSDGYSLEDFQLRTAQDLVDVCMVEPGHDDHQMAIAFCYGFFEGATHYDDAITGSEWHESIVCAPDNLTRTQAVAAFVQYHGANPQYAAEPAIDGIFRALIAKWPCAE